MTRLAIMCVLAMPLASCAARTNWPAAPQSATYRDLIAARRAGKAAPVAAVAEPVRRVVGRREGSVLVETRHPAGGCTTNARTLHVIYGAASVATNTHAQRAYAAALARYARALATDDGAADEAVSRAPAALHRQARRLELAAAKIEQPDRDVGGKAAAAAAAAAAGAAAAYGVAKKQQRRTS